MDPKPEALLFKLDRGTKVISKLLMLLSFKSKQLGQLIAQLEMIQQALAQIENGTKSVELGLNTVDLKIIKEAEYALDFGLELAKNVLKTRGNAKPSRIPQRITRRGH